MGMPGTGKCRVFLGVLLLLEPLVFIGDLTGVSDQDDLSLRVFRSFPFVKLMSYQEFFSSRKKFSDPAIVYFDFPHRLWDRHVEHGPSLYGTKEYGSSIVNLAFRIADQFKTRFPRARAVNHPLSIVSERDKLLAKALVREAGVPTVHSLDRHLQSVLDALDDGSSVYVKVRFGSLSKGITFLSPGHWVTNFSYDGRRIDRYPSERSWPEREVTGDLHFLSLLLSQDVVVEKAVENPLSREFRLGLRVYSVYGVADRRFAYASLARKGITSGASTGLVDRFLSYDDLGALLPSSSLDGALRLAERAASALHLSYAGIDILFEGDDFLPLFLEANSFPGTKNKSPSARKALLLSLYGGMFSDYASLSHH